MPVTLAASVDLAKVKMKWKEQYVSEGLNSKVIPGMPPGIYRGLRMSTNAAPRTVDIVADPVTGEHEAVCQTSNGYSLTYRDSVVGTIAFDLSDASLDSTDVVVALFMSYSITFTTVAQFRAYTLAEYNALSAPARDELVVFGTIDMPAAGQNITSGDILSDRRSLPWAKKAQGLVDWVPVIRNGGFELSEPNRTERYIQPFWDATISAGSFTWSAKTSDTNTGTRSLAVERTGAGAMTGLFCQVLNTPIASGHPVRLQMFKRVVQAATAGGVFIQFEYGDSAGNNLGNEIFAIDVSSVDGSFVKIDTVINIGTGIGGVSFLQDIRIFVSGAVVPSNGDAFLFDDIQLFIERTSTLSEDVSNAHREGHVYAHPLMMGPPGTWSDARALLRYDETIPATGQGGAVRIERDDQNSSLFPPSLSMLGRFLNVGDDLIGTIADALKSRMSGLLRASPDFTLIQEWGPSSPVDGLVRLYVNGIGSYHLTVNANYDGALWNKDIGGKSATRLKMDTDSPKWEERVSDTAWADGAWAVGVSSADASLLNRGTANGLYAHGNLLFAASTGFSTVSGTDIYLNPGGYMTTARSSNDRQMIVSRAIHIEDVTAIVYGNTPAGAAYYTQVTIDAGIPQILGAIGDGQTEEDNSASLAIPAGSKIGVSLAAASTASTAPSNVLMSLEYSVD